MGAAANTATHHADADAFTCVSAYAHTHAAAYAYVNVNSYASVYAHAYGNAYANTDYVTINDYDTGNADDCCIRAASSIVCL